MTLSRNVWSLSAVAVLALALIGCAWHRQDYQPKITLAQAREVALQAVSGGVVKSEELEKEKGKWVYSFDILSGKAIREIWVDPETGKLLLDEVETDAQERAEEGK